MQQQRRIDNISLQCNKKNHLFLFSGKKKPHIAVMSGLKSWAMCLIKITVLLAQIWSILE